MQGAYTLSIAEVTVAVVEVSSSINLEAIKNEKRQAQPNNQTNRNYSGKELASATAPPPSR